MRLFKKRATRKIVINSDYGGFSISKPAIKLYQELSGQPYPGDSLVKRDDKYLIEVIERLGDKARGGFAAPKIVEIPGNVKWIIEEFDGLEWVAEEHRTWD